MSLLNINLRKLLRIFYMDERRLTSELRADIRSEIYRVSGVQSSGGDFHAPFWTDAKNHVAGIGELAELTQSRIARNSRRERLYPLLQAGFLRWWNENRRWSNLEFQFIPVRVNGQYQFVDLDAIVKVENLIALRIGDDTNRLIYPYFSEEPPLHEEGARLGLWMMGATLDEYSIEDMRVLDVLRARSFATSDNPLRGNEQEIFENNYRRILERRARLRDEYN